MIYKGRAYLCPVHLASVLALIRLRMCLGPLRTLCLDGTHKKEVKI